MRVFDDAGPAAETCDPAHRGNLCAIPEIGHCAIGIARLHLVRALGRMFAPAPFAREQRLCNFLWGQPNDCSGGEGGIRSLFGANSSATYRFHIARVANDATRLALHCPILPDSRPCSASLRNLLAVTMVRVFDASLLASSILYSSERTGLRVFSECYRHLPSTASSDQIARRPFW